MTGMYLKLSSEHLVLTGFKSSLISCSIIWHYRTPSTKGIIDLFIDSDKCHSHTLSLFLYHQATIMSNTHTTLNVISKSGMVPNFTKRFQIISIIKPTRCTNVSNLFYFGITLHVSGGLSIHHQEFTTVHTVVNSWWWTERLPETCRVIPK